MPNVEISEPAIASQPTDADIIPSAQPIVYETPDVHGSSAAEHAVSQSDMSVSGTPTNNDSKLAATVAPQQDTTVARSVGRLRRADSVSVNLQSVDVHSNAISAQTINTQPPLTQENLEALWKDMLNAMKDVLPKLYDQLKDKEVALADDEDVFVVKISNNFTDQEMKPHLVRMLQYMRTRSGRPNLNCHTELVAVQREVKPYTARDKFDAMVAVNPMLDMFRVIFPDVEM